MLSIKELRQKEVYRLAGYKNANPTSADIAEAQKLMNSFYRLCGLCETNLYLANNENTCNRKSTQDSEQRECAWFNRLDHEFFTNYGLNLCYCGYMPSIGERDINGGFSEKIFRYFYN